MESPGENGGACSRQGLGGRGEAFRRTKVHLAVAKIKSLKPRLTENPQKILLQDRILGGKRSVLVSV